MHKIPIEYARNKNENYSEPERAVLILSGDREKKANIMTASWCTKVAKKPEILWAVSIGKDRYTQELIMKYGEFVIAFPDEEGWDLLYKVGTCHGNKIDKIKGFGIKTAKASVVKAPILLGCKGNLEIVVKYFKDNGSHYMFVGEVVEAWEG